jgi:endonuclease/exonuclease/phosphatase (EEP) superfamily protein YafD
VDYELMTVHGVWAPDGNETDDQKAMGKKISEYIQNKSNVILSGDFNINQKSECISGIEKDLTNIFKDERITSFNMKHKDKPGYASAVVDFVFASPAIKVLEHRTADVDVSDHQSQVVVFDL